MSAFRTAGGGVVGGFDGGFDGGLSGDEVPGFGSGESVESEEPAESEVADAESPRVTGRVAR